MDKAFEKLPSGTLENLLKPENKEKLTALLNHHVVSGKVLAADVKTGPVKADIIASYGVIHAIDAVILE